ncbi:MAG: protease SohB, partial [Calditrichia bacterium]
MEFLAEYGMFLAKLLTIAFILLLVAGGLFMLFMRTKSVPEGHLDVKNINQKYENMNLILKSQILTKKEFKKSIKELKAEHKLKEKKSVSDKPRKRIFVLDFNGDIKAS